MNNGAGSYQSKHQLRHEDKNCREVPDVKNTEINWNSDGEVQVDIIEPPHKRFHYNTNQSNLKHVDDDSDIDSHYEFPVIADDDREWNSLHRNESNSKIFPDQNAPKELLSYVEDVNAKGKGGITPLMQIIREKSNRRKVNGNKKGQDNQISQDNKQSFDLTNVMDYLINSGADKDAQDDNQMTALHFASLVRNEIATAKLLEHGANPNIKDNSGRTPLHIAITSKAETIFKVKIIFYLRYSLFLIEYNILRLN